MKRTLIGLLAAVLLASGVLLWMAGAASHSPGTIGGLVRMGMVTFAIWLAMPTIDALLAKTPRWMIFALGAVTAIIALVPTTQLLIFVVPIVIALWGAKSWLPGIWSMLTEKKSVSVSKTRRAKPAAKAPIVDEQPVREENVVEGTAEAVAQPQKPSTPAATSTKASGPKRRARPARE